MKDIKLTTDKLNKDIKISVVMRFFVSHPEVYQKYIHQLYLANLLSHMLDDILQDLGGYAEHVADRSVTQLMHNATKSMDKLIDKLYKETLSLGMKSKDYERITDDAYTLEPIINDIMQYILWDGKSNFRFIELKKKLNDLIPDEYRKKVLDEFTSEMRKNNQEIIKSLEADKNNDEKTTQIYKAVENLLIGKYIKAS